jgi:hypothetical protein
MGAAWARHPLCESAFILFTSRTILAVLESCLQPVWHIPLPSVQWINSWWWTEELSETCRFSCQNKFVKLVHLVGAIIKKFVTMHGHMNVKFVWTAVGGTHVETRFGYGLHTEALVYTMDCMKYIFTLQTLRELYTEQSWLFVFRLFDILCQATFLVSERCIAFIRTHVPALIICYQKLSQRVTKLHSPPRWYVYILIAYFTVLLRFLFVFYISPHYWLLYCVWFSGFD